MRREAGVKAVAVAVAMAVVLAVVVDLVVDHGGSSPNRTNCTQVAYPRPAVYHMLA